MPRYSQTAGGLAEDYMSLADEVFTRFEELAGAPATEPRARGGGAMTDRRLDVPKPPRPAVG